MKPIRYAAILVFATACSNEPAVQDQRSSPPPPSGAADPLSVPEQDPATADRKPAVPEPKAHGDSGQAKNPPPDKAVGTTAATLVDGVRVNTDALVMADFTARLDKYRDIRNKAKKDAPRLKETNEPGQIRAGENGLAVRIRALRADAAAGDIFTPAIRDVFRRLLSPELKGGEGRDAKATIKDDAPASVPLKVNADYPEGASLPTMPANLLANLPTLPEELDYRIINKHLILRDVDANMIVDYIPNVMR